MAYFACYGVVAHSVHWNAYSCAGGTPPGLRKGLSDLLDAHYRLHPDGRAAPRSLFNRCHEKLQKPLDELMRYAWAPALAAANASVEQVHALEEVAAAAAADHHDGGEAARAAVEAALARAGGIGEAAARVNHTWPSIIAQLDAARAMHVPLFRFM